MLILGGTGEASALAAALAGDRRFAPTLSYAGRVAAPKAQPVPVRVGGFGGVEGLTRWLRDAGTGAVVDATHPFAATMQANAVAACAAAGAPLLRLERPAWAPGPGDAWTTAPTLAAAAGRLAAMAPTVVFLAVGRLHLPGFAAAAHHRYLLRLVDPPEGPLPLPDARVVVARGPFDAAGDAALMRAHGVRLVVAKNAGGRGAAAKLAAARALGLPVLLVDRPAPAGAASVATVAQVLAWLHDTAATLRGV